MPENADIITGADNVQMIKTGAWLRIGETVGGDNGIATFIWCASVWSSPWPILESMRVTAFVNERIKLHTWYKQSVILWDDTDGARAYRQQ
jgi:hypothetical protein